MRIVNAGAQPVRSIRTSLDANLRRAYPWKARQMAWSTTGAAIVLLSGAGISIALGTWVVIGDRRPAVRGASRAARLERTAEPGASGRLAAGDRSARRSATTSTLTTWRGASVRDGPIFKTWLVGSPTVCIADLEFGRDLYKVHADDLEPRVADLERFVPGGTIREIDGPRHKELRRLRTRSLTAPLVRSWEPTLDAPPRGVARRHGGVPARDRGRPAALRARGGPCRVVRPPPRRRARRCRLPRGRGAGGRARPRSSPLRHRDLRRRDRDEARSADRTRAGPAVERGQGPVAAPSLAARTEEEQPGALSDTGIVRDFLFEIINTLDDTAGLLMWVLKFLADDPAGAARFRDAGADRAHARGSRGLGDPPAGPERVPLPSRRPRHQVPRHRDPRGLARPRVPPGAAPGSDALRARERVRSGSLHRRWLRPRRLCAVRHRPARVRRREPHPHHRPHLRHPDCVRPQLGDRA